MSECDVGSQSKSTEPTRKRIYLWKSKELVRSCPLKGRWIGSWERCELIHCFQRAHRRAQREGGPIEEIRPSDVVWFPSGEKHWHGVSPTTAMTHFAIQENLNGKVVEGMEKVTDEQYRGSK